eukprot:TRINITY_DN9858_c0_g1_i1.p1 TRINITY_DN9858_c0_g1~~TRINITY_DN9858_c0_g1_i1.p1  ORF type:complete len:312 (-),score=63.31 TRINITY_DN9858_c0_g1_i1:208-1143(-)
MSRATPEPCPLTPCLPSSVSMSPSGLLLTSVPGKDNLSSLCRSHSDTLLGPQTRPLKRKPAASPSHMRDSLRKRAHIQLSIDIPPVWLPPMDEHASPPRPVFENLCLSEETDVARAWVRNLAPRTRVLALDFDLTCIAINTKGAWGGTAALLAPHFRPLMRDVMLEALDQGLRVAVVSFSPQDGLIREVLGIVLREAAEQVMVRAGSPQHVSGGRARRNKQAHMESVLCEVGTTHHEQLRLAQVMLVDDDFDNVQDARDCGGAAVWFNPEETLAFVCDLCQCQEFRSFACSAHSCGGTHTPIAPSSPMLCI